jgi:16S rRNA (uracil1498-N3)-methyltransferase
VSASTFLVDPVTLSSVQGGAEIELNAQVAHHMKVTRMGSTEIIHLVDGLGTRARGHLMSPGHFRVDLVTSEPRPQPNITVAQALIKGDRLERAIEMMTEVGATAFIPWEAEHSIVKWSGDKAKKNVDKWVNVVRAATEQSRRSWTPNIFAPADSKALASQFADFDQVIFMEESNGAEFARISAKSVLLVVGPEGGISQRERALFEQLAPEGSFSLTIGTGVLRSATAGVVGLTHLFATRPSAQRSGMEG